MSTCQLKKAWFKPYDYVLLCSDKTYHIKQLKLTSSHQLTINSPTIWNIQSGKLSGVRFKVHSNQIINLSEFKQCQNPIILLSNKPYRILKYINESEVVDVSNEKTIHMIPIVIGKENLLKHHSQ